MVSFPKNLNSLPKEVIRNFLSSFDTVLTDCDVLIVVDHDTVVTKGVLWLENDIIEGSQHVINKFLEQKKSLFYVTNNSAKIREEYVEKCRKLGFIACEDNIISAAYLAADYLKSINFNKKVYVSGGEGIVKELAKVGIPSSSQGPDEMTVGLDEFINSKLDLDPEVGAVLQGFDPYFSYPKLVKAATYLSLPNTLFLATCPDETFRFNDKMLLPGTGALLRCVEAASGRKALVLGKPNDYIKESLKRKQNIEPARTLMIGDRCNTDILFGNKCGFQTLLVLTGVSTLEDVEKYASSPDPNDLELVPKFYVERLGDLLPHM